MDITQVISHWMVQLSLLWSVVLPIILFVCATIIYIFGRRGSTIQKTKRTAFWLYLCLATLFLCTILPFVMFTLRIKLV